MPSKVVQTSLSSAERAEILVNHYMKSLEVLLLVTWLLCCNGFASHRTTKSIFQLKYRTTSACIKKEIRNTRSLLVFTRCDHLAEKSVRISNKSRQSASAIYLNSGSNTSKSEYDRTLGLLVLLTVPLAWGTYAPVVKYVYDMQVPMPGFVFSACYYLIAAITLSLLSSSFASEKSDGNNDFKTRIDDSICITETSSGKTEVSTQVAGLELGVYLFLGNCLQVIGLNGTIPADRAAFLVQLTTIFVPLLSAAVTGNFRAIPISTWLACIIAFFGVVIMALDVPDADVNALISIFNDDIRGGLSFSGSDFLIILAALAYTMHVVRLGSYAKITSPLKLAASKATVEAILSSGLLAALLNAGSTNIIFLNDISSEVQTYFTTLNNQISSGNFSLTDSIPAIIAVLWTSWVTCAYTIYAQSYGQRRVSPTEANLIYSIQPIFSAVFAWALLDEHLGIFGYSGAALIGFAVWLAAIRTND